jgi:membrane-bound lytic murein transglycosylase D
MELPEPYPAIEFETVEVHRHLRLSDLDTVLALERKTLVDLNPELRHGTTPGDRYALRVPANVAALFDEKIAALPAYVPPPEVTFARYKVRSGDTLSTIALRHRTTVNAIMRANKIGSRHRIRIGQRLKVPQRGSSTPAVSAKRSGGSRRPQVTHTVRQGDSLWLLASRYGNTVDRIKRDNQLRSNRLTVGQKIEIRTGNAAGSRTYTVQSGDSVGRIAQAQNLSIQKILRANSLSRSSRIYPGQIIQLPN